MIVTAVLSALLAGGPCSIQGRLTFTRDGKPYVGKQVRAVVFVDKATPPLPPPEPKAPHQILQVNRTFDPPVLVVGVNETVTFENRDKEEHSVFSAAGKEPFDFPASKKGRTGEHTFINPGPVLVQCDRHEKMRTDVLVVKNDAWVMVGEDGTYQLTDLPAGKYTLKAWEPNGGTAPIAVPSCRGPTEAPVRQIEVGPDLKLTHKDGRAFLEYENY